MHALAATLLVFSVGQTSQPIGPAPLPIHQAADARKYLIAELLRRGGSAPSMSAGSSPVSAPPWSRLLTAYAATKADRVALELLYARLELADLKSQATAENADVAALESRIAGLRQQRADLRAAGQRPDKPLLELQRRVLRAEIERELVAAQESMTAENPRLLRLRQRAKAVLPRL
jgi:hypothetical protein